MSAPTFIDLFIDSAQDSPDADVPDWFVLPDACTHAFRLVGNAVGHPSNN